MHTYSHTNVCTFSTNPHIAHMCTHIPTQACSNFTHTHSETQLCACTHTHTYTHQHAPCISKPKGWFCPEGWKDYYGPESERGRDEPLNLWERELLPNKYSQSNRPGSFCLKLNELRFYRSSLMGSNWAFSLYPFLIFVFTACIPNNCSVTITCCSGIFCFMTVSSNNSL